MIMSEQPSRNSLTIGFFNGFVLVLAGDDMRILGHCRKSINGNEILLRLSVDDGGFEEVLLLRTRRRLCGEATHQSGVYVVLVF